MRQCCVCIHEYKYRSYLSWRPNSSLCIKWALKLILDIYVPPYAGLEPAILIFSIAWTHTESNLFTYQGGLYSPTESYCDLLKLSPAVTQYRSQVAAWNWQQTFTESTHFQQHLYKDWFHYVNQRRCPAEGGRLRWRELLESFQDLKRDLVSFTSDLGKFHAMRNTITK